MKKNLRILVVSAVMMLGATSAQAQFGNLVNKVKMAKQTAEDVKKKVDGDIEFTKGGNVMGFYRTRTGEFIFDKTHPDGERKGKKVIFKVQKNGDVMYDDGRKVGEVLSDGTVNFHGEQGYLKVLGDGSVMMDGEKVAMINDNGQVYIYDVLIGTAKGLDKQYAALLYLGIYHNKESLAKTKLELAEVKKQRRNASRNRPPSAGHRPRRIPPRAPAIRTTRSRRCVNIRSRRAAPVGSSMRTAWSITGLIRRWGSCPRVMVTSPTARATGSAAYGLVTSRTRQAICSAASLRAVPSP